MEPQIDQITIHKIGNKLNNGQVYYSKGLVSIDEHTHILLSKYFFSTLDQAILYNLYHESDLFLNEIYTYASRIFEDKTQLFVESRNIANHLYLKSEHPKIKDGDLYITYLTNCTIEGQKVDAIGIFKSENRDTVIKVKGGDGIYGIEIDSGANINKLDKGCIIYNNGKDKGYLVSIIDNSSKNGIEAQYWKDDFLHIKSRKDEYFHTNCALNFCKSFMKDYLQNTSGISKVERIDLLNKTANYFKENESFELREFADKILPEKDTKEAFLKYKNQYEQETETRVVSQFNISDEAVRKQVKSFKNTIKLDNNFRILIEGNDVQMKRGYDEEKRMSYYTLYFKNEE